MLKFTEAKWMFEKAVGTGRRVHSLAEFDAEVAKFADRAPAAKSGSGDTKASAGTCDHQRSGSRCVDASGLLHPSGAHVFDELKRRSSRSSMHRRGATGAGCIWLNTASYRRAYSTGARGAISPGSRAVGSHSRPNATSYTFSCTKLAPRSTGPGASARASTLASSVTFAAA